MRLLLCYLLCSIWHPSFLCPPLPAAAFIGFVLIKRKRLASGAAPPPRPDKQPRRSSSSTPQPPPGTLPLKDEDYAPLARGGSAMENGAAVALAASSAAAAAGTAAAASREVRRWEGYKRVHAACLGI